MPFRERQALPRHLVQVATRAGDAGRRLRLMSMFPPHCLRAFVPDGPARSPLRCVSLHRHVEGGSLFTNWQEVRVQEQSQGSAAAGAPRSITVLLQDDLADQAQVGGELVGSLLLCLAGSCIPQCCEPSPVIRPVCCAAVLDLSQAAGLRRGHSLPNLHG